MDPSDARDIRVRRCTVRVRRRGGWSWGPEPAAMAAAVARALPALIAEELARLVGERAGGAATQRAPVKVTLRVTRAELAALVASVPPGSTLPPRHASQGPLSVHADAAALPAPLRTGLRAAVAAALSSPEVAAGWLALPAALPAQKATASAELAAGSDERTGGADGRVLATLLRWLAEGTLSAQLAAAEDAVLEAWERALFAAPLAAPRPAGVRDADVERVVAAAGIALARWPRRRAAEARVILAVAARRALVVSLADPTLRAAIERASQAAASTAARSHAAAPASTAARPHAAAPASTAARAIDTPLAPGDARHITTALPFLALGALARLGWLGAAAAFLHAAGDGPATLAAFATAFAYKLVAAPARGWRRASDDMAAAACFAGCAAPVADHELARLADHLDGAAVALDAAARQPFLDGHVAGDPLVLSRARHAERDGWLIAESMGAFPLAWAPELIGLAPALASGDELVVVPVAAAAPEALAWLDALGRPFITDARPSRGEPWRPVTGESALYANRRALDHRRNDRAAVPAEAHDLAACAERITGAWHALAVDRPIAAHAPWRGLDASLTLATSLALADIAWRLFRTREPTDARLALERFADLDAHVTVSPGEVRVRLPLGRRYQHLREHGLCADIPRVPWWADRTIVFSGG